MIQYLLLFQFALLYWVTIVLGLIVYGSDFNSLSGKLYLLPMFVIPLMHRFYNRFAFRITAPLPTAIILIVGALLALVAYQSLHFAFWDEHNAQQAWLLSLLGLFSYLASVIASVRLRQWRGNHARAVSITWLVLGLVWMLAVAFPMIPLLAIAIIMLLGVAWYLPVQYGVPLINQPLPNKPGVLKYLLFLLVLDLSLIIWDYQVDSRWAWHLTGICITAALGSWLAAYKKQQLFWPVVIISAANFIAAIVWPSFVIHPLHSVVIGIGMGWVIGRILQVDTEARPSEMMGLAFPLFMGLITGYLFYANLTYVAWRTLLLVPLLAMLLRSANVAADYTRS